jgi:hypothetical protein
MDNLPAWALWIITTAVGLSPGLALLLVRPIARLLHRLLCPRPEIASQSQAGGELAEARRSPRSHTATTNAG